jgi:hypothetical protein
MKITIAPTQTFSTVDGTRARIWKGTTEEGIEVLLTVTRIIVPAALDQTAFMRTLHETAPPHEAREVPLSELLAIPMRLIL